MFVAGTGQTQQRETAAATYTDVVDTERTKHIDIAVDTSGAATLTVEVSATGEFGGEEFTVTVNYDSATEIIEQFAFAHRYIRAQVDQNLTAVEVVGRA
jgi:hypothetical protein